MGRSRGGNQTIYWVMLNMETGFKYENQRIFLGRARRPALGAFLRDIDVKIAGIPQCSAVGTILSTSFHIDPDHFLII